MATLKSLTDPLGHIVFISPLEGQCDSLEKIITNPAFIIEFGVAQLYYFRIIEWEMNMLVASKTDNAWYLADSCIQQPAPDYISLLLNKGGKVITLPK